jgi:hypothetical protein
VGDGALAIALGAGELDLIDLATGEGRSDAGGALRFKPDEIRDVRARAAGGGAGKLDRIEPAPAATGAAKVDATTVVAIAAFTALIVALLLLLRGW